MSVVATRVWDDHIIMASDSIRTLGYTQEKIKFGKLFMTDDEMLVGSCGLASEIGLFRIFLKTHKPREASEDSLLELFNEFNLWISNRTSPSKDYEFSNQYHLAFQGKAFYVNGYHIQPITKFHAIGAGSDFALAALWLGHDIEDAIGVSAELSVYCEKPVNMLTIPRKEK